MIYYSKQKIVLGQSLIMRNKYDITYKMYNIFFLRGGNEARKIRAIVNPER